MNVSLEHPVLVQLRERDIPFNVCGPHIELDGFGKAGTVKLVASPNSGVLSMISRYQEITSIVDFEDVLQEAWHWLKVSLARNGDRYVVHENWREAFIKEGWLPEGTLAYAGITREQWEAGEERRCCTLA